MQKKITKWKNSGRIDKIKKILSDENYKNRIEAVKALGEMGDQSAIGDIRKLINDPIKGVVIAAFDALKKLGADSNVMKEFESHINDIKVIEKKQSERRNETWKEKTEEEIQEDLERRRKMIGIHQIDKKARAIRNKNAKNAAIAKTIGKLFGS
jgi:HEAT repeat protein